MAVKLLEGLQKHDIFIIIKLMKIRLGFYKTRVLREALMPKMI